MKKLILISLLLLSLPVSAIDDSIRQLGGYNKASDEEKTLFLAGLGNGMQIYNVFLRLQSNDGLFCLPPNLATGFDIYNSIMKTEIERNSQNYDDDTTVGIILFKALQNSFPCN